MTPEIRAEYVKLARENAKLLHLDHQPHSSLMCELCQREAKSKEANARLAFVAQMVQLRSERQAKLAKEFERLSGQPVELSLSYPLGSPRESKRIKQSPHFQAQTAPLGSESVG